MIAARWTPEKVAELERLRTQSLSMKEIARVIGKSHRACSLKARRLGMARLNHEGKRRLHPVIDFLRVERRCRGLTQKQLAKRIGVGFNTLQGWELGLHHPQFALLDYWASTLGYTLQLTEIVG